MTEKKIFIVLVIALVLSLAGNFFFAGLYLGAHQGGNYHKSHHKDDDRTQAWRHSDDSFRKKLSDKDHDILRNEMKANKPRFKQAREELEAARDKVEIAMSAEPLDQAALDQALAEQKQKEDALRDMVQEMRAATAAKLSPEGRKAFSRFEGYSSKRRSEFHHGPDSQQPPAPQNAP